MSLFQKVDDELSEHEWLVGDRFSLADISWVPLHHTLIGVDFPVRTLSARRCLGAGDPRTAELSGGHAEWCPKF